MRAISIGAWLATVMAACAQSPSPAVKTDTPKAASPSSTAADEVVAHGSCWVLGNEPSQHAQSNSRWFYEHGLLQRVENYDEDRKTLRSTLTIVRDAAGRRMVETRAFADPVEEFSRVENDRDENGRLRSWKFFMEGALQATATLEIDAASREIGEAKRFVDGTVEQTTWTWVRGDDGGWTVTEGMRIERPATGDRPAIDDEYTEMEVVRLDARGRPIEVRSGAVCRYLVWDDRNRCVEATIEDACTPTSKVAAFVSSKNRRAAGEALLAGTLTYERDGTVATVRHEVDAAGNLVAIVGEHWSTRFEYEGEFRNAVCHEIEPDEREPHRWPDCDLSER